MATIGIQRFRGLLLAAGLLLMPALSFAQASPSTQAYPTKPIRLVVGVPPGGTTDLVARVVGEQLARELGQPVVVENRAGAAGNIGADLVAKSTPDGYTLFLAPIGTVAINPSLYANLPFDPLRDFAPISQLTSLPMAMVVNAAVPAKTVKEFIELARAQPGKINFASGGSGTGTHLAGELFKSMAGIEMVHVPYKGNGPAMVDLLAGRVSVMFDQVSTALPHMRAGKLRALGVTTAQRSSVAPDVPTLSESGLAGYDVTTWHGLVAPAGTPREVIARLNAAVVKALASPEVRERFKASGIEPVSSSPEQFGALMRGELARWREVIQRAGVKID
jgi:tripartite-type tricarboxylate transporter receptor subunit TctC